MYYNKETNTIYTEQELRNLYPNVSLPTVINANDLGLEVIFETPLPEVTEYQRAVFNGIIQDAKGNWVKSYRIEDLSEIEINQINENKANNIRLSRNKLLADSDWTQVADAPVDKTAWATYRQELRDITSQIGFPFNVLFPNPPL